MKTTIFYKSDEFILPTVLKDQDQPLFLAKDVCKSLGLSNISRALDGLDEDEVCKVTISNPTYTGQDKQRKSLRVSAITESGFYALAFKSRKPKAKRFRKWVTSEVLPQIRKYGTYTLKRENLKPGYKEIASNVFGIIGSKDGGTTTTQRVANMINKAVIGMSSRECKDKYNCAPREYIMKALKLTQSEGRKDKEAEYQKKLDEYDSVQHMVNHFLENGGHPLEVETLLKNMKYRL